MAADCKPPSCPLYTYAPRKDQALELVSKAPEGSIKDFELKQNRFATLNRANPVVFEQLADQAQAEVAERYKFYEALAAAKR